ncbi:prolyl oligopeptidase family serine peptidase [Allosphingosinicella deserti]|uniref:prolyl oligopeptidase family serine peptidase n=1 Tax=Allosphingosinicella deserti TaxID=2116704 RepID=UPI001E4BCC47|nr:prolyl oligopeptidase family serine peptidase [Sphingomonas deserti]
MHRFLLSAAALILTAAAAPASRPAGTVPASASADDPYLWLEEVEGPRALAQVRDWNRATEDLLTQDPKFADYQSRARAILDDEQQIATPDQVMGDLVLNLWRDAKNPRGLWRASPLAAYRAGKPAWRTVIDVDALGKAEGKSWVWHGADCLAPDYRRCLVSLSPGGTDADVVREFDLERGRFVDDGFVLPEAKSNVAWVDADTLLVVTDYGPNSLTASGYGRIAKLWKRGTPLAAARTVFEGETADVSVSPVAVQDGTRRWTFVTRGKTFWTSEQSLLTATGQLVRLPLPEDAEFQTVLGGRLIAKLQSPLDSAGKRFAEGSLIAYDLDAIDAGRSTTPELVMAPSARQAIEEVVSSDTILWVKALDDVSGKLFAVRRGADERWTTSAAALPANSSIRLQSTAGKSDMAFAIAEGMLTPPTLYAVGSSGAPTRVQSLPAKFDSARFSVEQRFATSKDGTRIPYFLVRRKGAAGAMPALIHAYGGFRAAQTPGYLTGQPYRAGPLGMFWVEEGNAYVLANIRGGGEYGPEWHRSVLRENRQKSFDDLHAVAEDLIRTGVSTKGRIGISGRSNGGVLVGAALTQRPDLYSAVISGSPLHDMKRYSHMLAGASWVGEYGDPDVPADWAFLSRYSPYQNVKPGVKYPAVFFYSSTKDDRVHPGHARKMAARLGEYGNRFYFHEYLEGGHSVGADHAEDAKRAALLMTYLKRELGGPK